MATSQLSAWRGKPVASIRARRADARAVRGHSRRSHVVKAGVTVESVKEGDGQTFPKPGQVVTVHYTGALTSGKKFDSSRDRGQPFRFTIGMGMVIKGWDEGVSQMSVGQRATLTCTPDYAYGEDGFPPVIPPSSTLVFDVELLEVQ